MFFQYKYNIGDIPKLTEQMKKLESNRYEEILNKMIKFNMYYIPASISVNTEIDASLFELKQYILEIIKNSEKNVHSGEIIKLDQELSPEELLFKRMLQLEELESNKDKYILNILEKYSLSFEYAEDIINNFILHRSIELKADIEKLELQLKK